MTDQVRSWGNSAGGNNVAGGLFQEGLLANLLSDNLRQLQAAIRGYANQAEWFAIGDLSGPATFTFLTATSFRVQGISLASRYQVGRRVRATGVSTGTITGTITAVAANSGNTDVTVAWDSGTLKSETLLIELGINSAVGSSVPAKIDHALEIIGLLTATGDATITGDASVGGTLGVGGRITADDIRTTGGPYTMFAMGRVVGAGSITFPGSAVQALLKIWSASGGGASAPDSFSSDTGDGTAGGTTTISSSPSGRVAITISGGAGATLKSGIDLTTATGFSPSGSAIVDSNSIANMGMPGGRGANFGASGLPGHYAEVLIDATLVTSLTVSGGAAGTGGVNSGEASGGDGASTSILVEFFR
ncbi:MAG: hypothetical protein R3F54_28685 [Alphaproteobacteria bacterium]